MATVITNDSTRDIAIRITDRLVELGVIPDCINTENDTEFEVQDLIHETINTALDVTEDNLYLLKSALENY